MNADRDLYPDGPEKNAPQDAPHTSEIQNPRKVESSNMVHVPCSRTTDTTLVNTGFESYDTLAALNILHSSTNAH